MIFSTVQRQLIQQTARLAATLDGSPLSLTEPAGKLAKIASRRMNITTKSMTHGTLPPQAMLPTRGIDGPDLINTRGAILHVFQLVRWGFCFCGFMLLNPIACFGEVLFPLPPFCRCLLHTNNCYESSDFRSHVLVAAHNFTQDIIF